MLTRMLYRLSILHLAFKKNWLICIKLKACYTYEIKFMNHIVYTVLYTYNMIINS